MAPSAQTIQVEVQSRIVDGRPEGPRLKSVLVEFTETRITAGDLIRRTVEEQVWDLLHRKKLVLEDVTRALDRQYLTDEDIEQQGKEGAIRFRRRRERGGVRTIDPEKAVERAKRAFRSGVYRIIVDGRQVSRLDEKLTLAQSSRVTFLRLTPLVGG
jgi:hypothetical protein